MIWELLREIDNHLKKELCASCFGLTRNLKLEDRLQNEALDANSVSDIESLSHVRKSKIKMFSGPDVTENFLKRNKLDYVIRSHEVKDMGYEIAHDGKCITVFSAPNYCDTMGNKGAYIILNGKEMKPQYEVYDAVPHPNVKPMQYANSL